MSEQDGTQRTALEHPTNDDRRAWEVYWAELQPKEWFEAWGYWRTEPEIDEGRKIYLTERRAIQPDIKKGTYPFKNIKLSRADVEWLLATLENGRGPIDWNDESQRKRNGLDLRGTILNKANLSGLPLACMLGGLGTNIQITSTGETVSTTTDQRAKAAIYMEGTDLFKAHLEGANLSRGRLNRANIREAHLKKTEFFYAHLENAYLSRSHLENAILHGCHLQGTSLHHAHLEGAELRRAIFNNVTNLEGIYLGNQEYGYAILADISWGDANLTVVDWAVLKVLGDEQVAHQWKTKQEGGSEMKESLEKYRSAVRAYRQLAVALQGQGMNEHAANFAYRAQVLQRQVLQQQLLQRLKQTNKILDENKYHSFFGLDELSDILLLILSLLQFPSLQLLKLEQMQKNFFLKSFTLIIIQLLFFLYLIALFVLMLFILLLRLPLLWLLLPLIILAQAAFITIKFLIKRVQGHQRLQSILNILRVEKLRQAILSENQEFLLISKLFLNMIADNGQYAFSLLLDLLAGYGYKPVRTLFCYLIAVIGFAFAYNKFGNITSISDALVFSLTSFHGRGFFPNLGDPAHPLTLHDTLVRLAAAEAVIGLFIEVSFIATFTKRFFGN